MTGERLAVLALCLLPAAALAQDDQTDGSFTSAMTSGKVGVGLRYRYEFVDEDGISDNANASTARLRLNYRTGEWQGWSAFGEFDNIFHMLVRDFNSGAGTSPNRTQYPVVADPKGPDLNQLYVDYTASDLANLRIGRQRINFDNQRFIGGVGWRQNEQTFDALTVTTDRIPKTQFSYSYNSWVRRIFGSTVPAGKAKVNNHLLNGKITINDRWSAVPYIYYLDYDSAANAANSTATLGVRFAGSLDAGSGKLALVGEIATQSDAANNPVSYDAQYYHLDALWTLSNGLTLGLGLESLGGDSAEPGKAFRTPLATLHKFQGWADRFLATPDAGVNDVFVSARYKFGEWKAAAFYHDFSADAGSGSFGKEFDVSVARSFSKNFAVLFKGAFFSGDAPGFPDTTKFWIQFNANY